MHMIRDYYEYCRYQTNVQYLSCLEKLKPTTDSTLPYPGLWLPSVQRKENIDDTQRPNKSETSCPARK